MITATEHDVLHAAAAAVARDLNVAYVAIELACAPELRAEHGTRIHGPLVTVPLDHRGAACGRLLVGGRLNHEQRRRLEAVAAQLALIGELARRNREDKRRYLHEDLGQTLAAMSMTLDAAANLLARDPAAAARLVRGVRDQSRDAVLDVRRIVSRLRSPALDEAGLLGALRRLDPAAARLELPADLPPLPSAVELAALEFVRTALEHGADHIRVSGEGGLAVELHARTGTMVP